MAKRIGFEGKLYYGVAGATAAVEITNCQDVSYTLEPEKAEVSTRANIHVLKRVAMLALSIEWTMIQNESDTTLTALKTAAVAGNDVALRTRDYASGYGVDGDFTLSMEKGEPLKGEQTVKFTAEPTDESARYPVWS